MYVRALNLDLYDHENQRFRSVAFEPSSDGGLSVFDENCAVGTSGSVCEHLKRFYEDVAGTPPVFWAFGEADLPPGSACRLEDGGNDDPCHMNVYSTTGASVRAFKKACTSYFKEVMKNDGINRFEICDPDQGRRRLTADDINRVKP